MLRNGFYLPKLKSSMVTGEYMEKVREGVIWCPKYKDVRLRPCPDPPTKETLMNILAELTTKFKLDFGAKEYATPDKEWLLICISSKDPDNSIFSKSYMPPAR